MTATMISCGVRCARDFVLEPSDAHAVAEMLFELEVESLCKDIVVMHRNMPRFVTQYVCDRVQVLHDDVERGDVRRQAAALAASRLQTLPQPIRWSGTLLYVIMAASTHNDGCPCMTHVLSWGTCPSVLTGPAPHVTLDASDTYDSWTPFWLTIRPRPATAMTLNAKWREELLAYGSVPWIQLEMASSLPNGPANRYTMTLHSYACGAPTDVPMFKSQAQWRRWHARRARLAWVTVAVDTIEDVECPFGIFV